MATKSIRLSADFINRVQSVAAVQHRSVPNQIEYWANLGRAISSFINMEDVFAIRQGLKQLRVEPVETISIDSDTVFETLETDREKDFADKPITSAPFYFEASQTSPGLLDRVDCLTGERKTGTFSNGEFKEVNA